MVVDFPAPFGPRNPKTSPLVTVRLRLSTATKSPKRLTRFSTSTETALPEFGEVEVVSSGMVLRFPRHRMHKQVFNRRSHLENPVETHTGVLEQRVELGDASARIVNHNVHTVAGKNQA